MRHSFPNSHCLCGVVLLGVMILTDVLFFPYRVFRSWDCAPSYRHRISWYVHTVACRPPTPSLPHTRASKVNSLSESQPRVPLLKSPLIGQNS